jgi:hypothetical protein
MAKPKATPKPPVKPARPHSGVDRRRKDMRGRKYTGTAQIGTKY